MGIPSFNEYGFLPEGIHDCTLEEAKARFGSFQTSDRRPLLWAKLMQFVQDARTSGVVESLLINGSFVTATPEPNDIDLVVVALEEHGFTADLKPAEYNVLSRRQVRRRFGFDILVGRAGTDEEIELAEFFQQVRGRPLLRKGLIRIRL